MNLYLANLWLALRDHSRFAQHVAALESRVAEFETKAAAQFQVRSNAQRKRAKPAISTTTGAQQ